MSTRPRRVGSFGTGAALFVLVNAMTRSGAGGYAGRKHATTVHLVKTLVTFLGPDGKGQVTMAQLALGMSCSARTVRRHLGDLETQGIVFWHRGGIHDGRPGPSYVEVDKAALIALLPRGRQYKAEQEALIARDTDARIADLPDIDTNRRLRKRSTNRTPRPTSAPNGDLPGPRGPRVEPFRDDPAPRDPVLNARGLAAVREVLAAVRSRAH